MKKKKEERQKEEQMTGCKYIWSALLHRVTINKLFIETFSALHVTIYRVLLRVDASMMLIMDPHTLINSVKALPPSPPPLFMCLFSR